MSFRFLHTADLHLDSPLKSLSMRNEALAHLIGNASRQALTRIVDLAIEEKLDAVLIAGDLYDGQQTSMKTARFLMAQLQRLDNAKIPTFIIRGNHDAEAGITKELTFPDSVTVFNKKTQYKTLNINDTQVAIHGVSFSDKHREESFLPLYKAPLPDHINIGMMHTSLDGAEGHSLYAPCRITDLHEHGYNYWALGHIHKRMNDQSSFSNGNTTVVMPGIPQGRDIGESGAKSVSIVSITNNGETIVEERHVNIAEFGYVNILIDDVSEWKAVLAAIEQELQEKRKNTQAQHLVARITLTGNTELSWQLINDQDVLLEDVSALAERIGGIWIDKIKLDVTPHREKENIADPINELSIIVNEIITKQDSTYKEIENISTQFRQELPSELRSIMGNDPTEFAQFLQSIMQEGSLDVLARLKKS